MKRSIFVILVLSLFNINAYALVPSDVDITSAIIGTGVVFTAILGLIVTRHGYKKVLNLFGK
jgi:uncharacterized MnhB-related membrane protein